MNTFVYIYLAFVALGVFQLLINNKAWEAVRGAAASFIVIVPFLYLPPQWAVGAIFIGNVNVILNDELEDNVRIVGGVYALVALLFVNVKI